MGTSVTTAEQRIDLFTDAIMAGENQSDAYRKAFPASKNWKDKTIHTKASVYMKSDEVQERLALKRAKVTKEGEITAMKVLSQLVLYATFDVALLYCPKTHTLMKPWELPKEIRPAVTGVTFHPNGNVKEYKFVSKDKNIELLGRYFNMFGEKLGDTPGEENKDFDLKEVARKILFTLALADKAESKTQH